jgi:sugar phosphate permease
MTAPPRRADELTASHRWLVFVAIMIPYVFYAFCWNTENFLRPYMAQALALSKPQVAAFYTLQALGALLGAVVLSQVSPRALASLPLASYLSMILLPHCCNAF